MELCSFFLGGVKRVHVCCHRVCLTAPPFDLHLHATFKFGQKDPHISIVGRVVTQACRKIQIRCRASDTGRNVLAQREERGGGKMRDTETSRFGESHVTAGTCEVGSRFGIPG